MTSFAALLAPLTVGTLADATTLHAALGAVPILLILAAVGLLPAGDAGNSRSPSCRPTPSITAA